MFSSCCDDIYEEESYDSSKDLSSCNTIEHVEKLVVEVLCEEEEVCYGHGSDFLDYVTNESTISSCSIYLDNSHNQGEEVCNEVLLSVDEISDLLALDFERYANLSKDICALPHSAFSCDEVLSPKT